MKNGHLASKVRAERTYRSPLEVRPDLGLRNVSEGNKEARAPRKHKYQQTSNMQNNIYNKRLFLHSF